MILKKDNQTFWGGESVAKLSFLNVANQILRPICTLIWIPNLHLASGVYYRRVLTGTLSEIFMKAIISETNYCNRNCIAAFNCRGIVRRFYKNKNY